MGHGRADEAGPLLAQNVKETSAGNGQAQSSVPTFFGKEEVCTNLKNEKSYGPGCTVNQGSRDAETNCAYQTLSTVLQGN